MNKTCSPENDKAEAGGSSVTAIDSVAVDNFSERYGVDALSKVDVCFFMGGRASGAGICSQSFASDQAGRLNHGIHPWCMFKGMSMEHPCFTSAASDRRSPRPRNSGTAGSNATMKKARRELQAVFMEAFVQDFRWRTGRDPCP